MNAQRAYETFHGKNPRKSRGFDFRPPKALIVLGKAVAVEYETDKLNGGGDGKKAVYRHDFETPSFVCVDPTMKRQLYIVGSHIKVTDAGIEN